MTPTTPRADALIALLDFVLNQAEHGDECPFWRQSGTEEDCICGLLKARQYAAALSAPPATPPADAVPAKAAVTDARDAARYRWLKTASKAEYLIARGVFGLDDAAIDAALSAIPPEATT